MNADIAAIPTRARQGTTTLTNLYLATGAFALGVIAQQRFGDLAPAESPVDGLLVYGLAAVLYVAALLRGPRPFALPVSFRLTGFEDSPARYGAGIALAILCCAATLASLDAFGKNADSRWGWLFYLAAIALFLGSAYGFVPARLWLPWRDNDTHQRMARWEWVALALVLVIALGFRLVRFRELPEGLWYDEADNGLSVRRILADPNYWPLYVPSTNLPAHFLHLVALSFSLLGDSMYAIRAVAVVFGMLTVVAGYVCGRELFGTVRGRYLALIFAMLLAVSRWGVTWSRIGMHGITLPFFELWVLAALLRALRTGRITSFAWVGVAMGLGLCFYSPFRIFPVIVAGFALAWFVRWLAHERRERPVGAGHVLSTWGIPVALVILGTLVAVAPVAQFSLRHPEVFWDRAKRISVFTDPNVQARPVSALLESTTKHLLMFNYRGDPNGRHNLPGAPMVDRLSGVLMVLGVLVCLVNLGRPRSILFLLWLLVPLSGGILSTWFEAPQSLRSFGAMPAVYALACLPLEWLASEWRRVFPAAQAGAASSRRSARGVLATGAIALLTIITLENGVTYFYVWARDFASWAAFNPAETHMAQDIERYREQYDLRFDPLVTAHLATRYLAPDYPLYQHFDPATVFPIAHTSRDGIVLYVAPDTRAVREQAEALYDGVVVEPYTHQGGTAVLYRIQLPREAIEGVQSLDARYVPLESTGSEGFVRVDPMVDFRWDDQPPIDYPFEVTWTGGLLADEYGHYGLQVDVAGECALYLDGVPAMAGAGAQRREVVLAQGVHALYLSCAVTQPGQMRLAWQRPGSDDLETVPRQALYRASWPINGLVGRFYENDSWSGDAAFVRIDRQIAHYFHYLPLPRPYTVHWTGRLLAPVSGTYILGLKAISGAALTVGGKVVIEPSSPGEVKTAEVYLVSGLHDLDLHFLDNQSHSQVYLYWQLPEGDLARIPPDALFLPQDGAWWPAPRMSP